MSVKFAAICTRAAANAVAVAAVEPPPGAGVRAAMASSTSCSERSEKADSPTLGVDVDVDRGGLLAQPRHLHDVAAQRHQPPRSGVGADVADGQREVVGCVQ